ncbi:putative F-box protein-like isoform X1 [Capsicum annuum]|nr:putative F-box protein-like isoform X1 [Capsicum annuum]
MNFFKPKQTSPTSSSSLTPPHQNLQQTFKNLQTHFTNFLQTTMPQLNPLNTSQNSPPWAKIDVKKQPLSTETIEERLGGVPVEADAGALLKRMESMDPSIRNGSRVVPVALNKVFQLKVDGVAFRLIPEASQVKNAMKEIERAGTSDDSFYGVPVFQSRSLVLKSQKRDIGLFSSGRRILRIH